MRTSHPRRRLWLVVGVLSVVVLLGAAAVYAKHVRQKKGDPALTRDLPRTIVAGFLDRSYAPGQTARYALTAPAGMPVTMQILRAGSGPRKALGAPVTAARTLGPRERRVLQVGNWPSGLYFAEFRGRGGWLGYAPLIVRPKRLGEHRVLVVLPTNTWEAYNFRNGDSWYYDSSVHDVDLQRPYLDRGVPPHYTGYDQGFERWLAQNGKQADVVSDDDYERIASGDRLHRLYDLVVFPGHEEYVTPHAFDITERYRDLGGNLAWLSANGFFYKVTKHGHVMHGRPRYRDEGRPEATLLGAQYLDWELNKYANRRYIVRGATTAPWFFRGTGLRNGESWKGSYGIEINARTKDSPPGVQLLANIPNIFGPGKTAEMTYYETARGARVFDAGTMNFGGTADYPVVRTMIANLWARLTKP